LTNNNKHVVTIAGNKLNVTVWAPSDYLWAYPDGTHVIAAKSKSGQMDQTKKGKFIKFVPGGNKK
ncbi:MAG: hypothetical protein II606_05805, partial [Erysipelotrichaceae bacterium]|nr:hypothetical protein [Erysipelotrichaceae bacterium]